MMTKDKKNNIPDNSADTTDRVGPTESGEKIGVPHPKKPQFDQDSHKHTGCGCGGKKK